MPSKTLRIVSVSMNPKLLELVAEEAKKRRISKSDFICKWLKQFPFEAKNSINAVVVIPDDLTKDKEKLTEYLGKKSRAIASAICG